MELRAEDFEKLYIRVDLLGERESVLETFPQLKSIKLFNTEFDQNLSYVKVFKFIVYLYDRHSPFRNIKDIGLRRVEVADYVSFNKETGKFLPQYMDIILWKNDKVNAMAIEYCRLQKSIVFSKLCMREDWLYKQYEEISTLNYEKTADRKRAYDQLNDMEKDLESIINEFVNEDNSYPMRKKVLEFIEEERIVIRPETVAKNIKQKKPPLGTYSPYDGIKAQRL